MKQWMNRFALLAAIAGIMTSALVVGCGGGEAEDTSTNSANATNGAGGTDSADTP